MSPVQEVPLPLAFLVHVVLFTTFVAAMLPAQKPRAEITQTGEGRFFNPSGVGQPINVKGWEGMSVAYMSWLIDAGNKRGRVDLGGRPGSKEWDSTTWWDATGTYAFDNEGCGFYKKLNFDFYDDGYTNNLRFVGQFQYTSWNNQLYDTYVGRVMEDTDGYLDALDFYEPNSGIWRGGVYLGVNGYGDLWWLDNVNGSVPAPSNFDLPTACIQAKTRAATAAELEEGDMTLSPSGKRRKGRRGVGYSSFNARPSGIPNLASLITHDYETGSTEAPTYRESMQTQSTNKITLQPGVSLALPPAYSTTGKASLNPTRLACSALPKSFPIPCTWTVTQAHSKAKESTSYVFNFDQNGKKMSYHEIDNSVGSFMGNATSCSFSASYQSFHAALSYGYLGSVTYTGGRSTKLYIGFWDDAALETTKKLNSRYGSFLFLDANTNTPFVELEAIPSVRIGGCTETVYAAPTLGSVPDSTFALSPACVARQKKGCDAPAAAACLTKVFAGGVLASSRGQCLFTAQVANCHGNEMCLNQASRVCSAAGTCNIRLCDLLKKKGG